MTRSVPILLHACCAPCASASVERLTNDGFQVTLFFSNSNIAPFEEFYRRRKALRDLADVFRVRVVEDGYDHASWLGTVKGLEKEPEKGLRCSACFRFNLAVAARKADELGIRSFTTSLSVSPHKDSTQIFEAATHALRASSAHADFADIDFKKKDGFKRSLEISEKLGLYRQDYCGCEFSCRLD